MEEEIKVLEKFTKIVKGKDYNAENGWHGYYDNELMALGKSIENLIAGYKELEEENKQLEAIKDEAIRRYNFESIPKSLVKEKVEELNSRIEKYREYTEQGIETDIEWVDNVADRETVKVLQDLLERSGGDE